MGSYGRPWPVGGMSGCVSRVPVGEGGGLSELRETRTSMVRLGVKGCWGWAVGDEITAGCCSGPEWGLSAAAVSGRR